MSVRPGLKRTQGKGDAWRVKLSAFRDGMEQIRSVKRESTGRVTHMKNGFTRTTYKA